MSGPIVKLCGLRTPETVSVAIEAGADMIGFVFYPASPRVVSLELARELGTGADAVTRVGLLVDPDDATVDAVAETGVIDLLQLHGAETPERVDAVKRRTGLPAMKVMRVADAQDVSGAAAYDGVADWILFDAKAPKGVQHALPGGNGLAFDWHLLDGLSVSTRWMLAGGLNPSNVATAIRLTRAPAVDASSGLEVEPGVKDPAKMRAFVRAAKQVDLESVA